MELSEGLIRPADRRRRDVEDYGMSYPLFTVSVKAAQHSYSDKKGFQRKAWQYFRRYVINQPEEPVYTHGKFNSLEDWHSLPDMPSQEIPVTGTKASWLTGPLHRKDLQHWQKSDAALKDGPTPAPMPKAARELVLKGRKIVVYDNVKLRGW